MNTLGTVPKVFNFYVNIKLNEKIVIGEILKKSESGYINAFVSLIIRIMKYALFVLKKRFCHLIFR